MRHCTSILIMMPILSEPSVPSPLPQIRSAWLRLQLNTKIVLNHLPTQHQLRALTYSLGPR